MAALTQSYIDFEGRTTPDICDLTWTNYYASNCKTTQKKFGSKSYYINGTGTWPDGLSSSAMSIPTKFSMSIWAYITDTTKPANIFGFGDVAGNQRVPMFSVVANMSLSSYYERAVSLLAGSAGETFTTALTSGHIKAVTSAFNANTWNLFTLTYDKSSKTGTLKINNTTKITITGVDAGTATGNLYHIVIGGKGTGVWSVASTSNEVANVYLDDFSMAYDTTDTPSTTEPYTPVGLNNPTQICNFIQSGSAKTLQLYSDVSGADFITPHSGTAHLSPLLDTSDSKASVMRVIKSGTVYAPGTY